MKTRPRRASARVPAPKMRRIAARLASSLPDASIDIDDLCQEARVKVWLRRDHIAQSLDPVASMYRAAEQAMIDVVRKAYRTPPVN